MALAVAETKIGSTSNAASLALTAPDNTAEGDLLIIIACSFGASSVIGVTGFTNNVTTSWTPNGTTEREHTVRMLYKIADSGDEAASTYTVTFSSDYGGAACILRVTGWTTGDPVYASSTGQASPSAGGTIAVSSLSLSRPHGQLLIMAGGKSSTDGAANYTHSAYTITSSDSNPTWTEVIDVDFVANGGTDTAGLNFFCAYATSTDTSTITAYSYDFTETSGDAVGACHMLAVLVEPTSETGTNALLSVAPATFSEASVEVGGIGNNALHEVASTLNTQNGKGTAPTSWTNEVEAATTWTNEEQL